MHVLLFNRLIYYVKRFSIQYTEYHLLKTCNFAVSCCVYVHEYVIVAFSFDNYWYNYMISYTYVRVRTEKMRDFTLLRTYELYVYV